MDGLASPAGFGKKVRKLKHWFVQAFYALAFTNCTPLRCRDTPKKDTHRRATLRKGSDRALNPLMMYHIVPVPKPCIISPQPWVLNAGKSHVQLQVFVTGPVLVVLPTGVPPDYRHLYLLRHYLFYTVTGMQILKRQMPVPNVPFTLCHTDTTGTGIGQLVEVEQSNRTSRDR